MTEPKDSDVLLWDNDPPLPAHRWINTLTIYTPPNQRDFAWTKAHGWEWSYYPDGTKTARIGNKTIRFPDGI